MRCFCPAVFLSLLLQLMLLLVTVAQQVNTGVAADAREPSQLSHRQLELERRRQLQPRNAVLNVSINSNNNDSTPWQLVVAGQALLATAITLMIIGTLVGNVLVALAVLLVKKLHQPANYLLVSLAVADFFVGLFVMPLALIYIITNEWKLGGILCDLWTSADVTLCTASILNLCFISIDRYWAISKPLRYGPAQRTTKRILIYIAIVWVTAILISVTPLIVLHNNSNPGKCQVSQNRFYQIYATLISFYLPTVIMIIVYVKIWLTARRLTKLDKAVRASVTNTIHCHSNSGAEDDYQTTTRDNSLTPAGTTNHNMNNNNTNNNNFNSNTANNGDIHVVTQHSGLLSPPSRCSSSRRGHSFGSTRNIFTAIRMPFMRRLQQAAVGQMKEQRDGKARKTLGVIMTVFVVCWSPFFLLALLKSNWKELTIPVWVEFIVLWLGYSNSLLNPIIYAKYNREFRIPFREMLCCRFRTLKSVMRNENFNQRYGPSLSTPAHRVANHLAASGRIKSPASPGNESMTLF